MIDYSDQIGELKECKGEFDRIGKRLFDLEPDTEEKDFSTQEMFALAAQIIYTRKRIADVIADIQDKLQEDGMPEEESGEMMEVLYQDFGRDNDMMGTLVEDIAVLKRNNLAHSLIERYEDMLFSIIEYCETGKDSHLKKRFKDIAVEDMNP